MASFSKKTTFLLLLALLCFFCSCSKHGSDPVAETVAEESDFLMNTYVTFRAYGPDAQQAVDAARKEVAALETSLSAFVADSDISALNEEAGTGEEISLSANTVEVLSKALLVANDTRGAFDPAILPLVNLWNITGDVPRVPSQQEIDVLLPLVDYKKIALHGNMAYLAEVGMGVDLGGIGKGYAADLAIAAMKETGAGGAIVSLGGNISTCGQKPDGTDWVIGIQDPFSRVGEIVGTLSFKEEISVVTSGDYERFFVRDGIRYHHILDPETGAPANNTLTAVSVVCRESALADAYATALFVMGEERAIVFGNDRKELFDYILVTKDRRLILSDGLKENFQLSSDLYSVS